MFHKHVLLTANRYTCRCVVSRNQGANIVAVCYSVLYEGVKSVKSGRMYRLVLPLPIKLCSHRISRKRLPIAGDWISRKHVTLFKKLSCHGAIAGSYTVWTTSSNAGRASR